MLDEKMACSLLMHVFPPLSAELLELRTLAVDQIFGRIVGTPQQVTYLNGDLPIQMIHNIKHTMDGGVRFFAYHGHREVSEGSAIWDARDDRCHAGGGGRHVIPLQHVRVVRVHM